MLDFTLCQVPGKPRVQGIKPNAWTKSEDALMREHFPATGANVLVDLLPRRTRKAILDHAGRIGLTSPKGWTPEQDAVLLEHYTEHGSDYCVALTGRTALAVRQRARRLGLQGDHSRCGRLGAEARKAKYPQKPKREPKSIRFRRLERGLVRPAAPKLAGEPIITPATVYTIAPPFVDRRWLPDTVARVVDSGAARPWAAAVAG